MGEVALFGFRVSGFGFRVSGFGFRVSGSVPTTRSMCPSTGPVSIKWRVGADALQGYFTHKKTLVRPTVGP